MGATRRNLQARPKILKKNCRNIKQLKTSLINKAHDVGSRTQNI
jgi:hypothetical protein